jgi:Tol biopolymer transport system component
VITRFALLAVVAALACALAAPADAAFPGANGKLAYESADDGDWEIYAVDPDGTGKAQLTQNSGLDRAPAWSPDGSRLAFVCCAQGAEEVWVMSAMGGDRVQLTEGAGSAGSPAWSPDGARIVFSRAHCAGSCSEGLFMELRTVNADGTGETEVLEAGFTLEPRWSPDGAEIAIGYGPAHGTPWIATVAPDGSNLRSLTLGDNCFDYGPDWSPDGARLVFEGDNALYTINRDGSGRSRPCIAAGAFAGEAPVWSPDGTRIAFVHRGPSFEVRLANPDFTGEQSVTDINPSGVNLGPPRGLDWQPLPVPADGKNRSKACKGERERLGPDEFAARYGGGAGAHGKCVSGKR